MSNPEIERSAPAIPHRRSPIDVALDILKEKYPDALFAFVAGSFNRGEATLFSDIDMVVIFGKVDNAWRESFLFEDWPVEAFVHDPETLRYFFHEVDAKSGVLSLPAMVLEGPAVPFAHPLASELRTMARNLLSSPATIWDTHTLNAKRYGITDLVDDLRDPRTTLEAAATIGLLHEQLGDFYFRAQGSWSASKKHIPRRLARIDPALAARWEEAFLDAWRGERNKLLLLTEEILSPYGGFLFSGHRLDAPPDWRRSG
jgi:Nucleotidyltransferase domain